MLKDQRTRVGMTQRQLAEKSGVPYRTIQDWERFGVSPHVLKQLKKLADALGCGVADLIS